MSIGQYPRVRSSLQPPDSSSSLRRLLRSPTQMPRPRPSSRHEDDDHAAPNAPAIRRRASSAPRPAPTRPAHAPSDPEHDGRDPLTVQASRCSFGSSRRSCISIASTCASAGRFAGAALWPRRRASRRAASGDAAGSARRRRRAGSARPGRRSGRPAARPPPAPRAALLPRAPLRAPRTAPAPTAAARSASRLALCRRASAISPSRSLPRLRCPGTGRPCACRWMNSLRGSTWSPIRFDERLLGGQRVVERHLQQRARRRVHRRLPELLRVHLAEALVALDRCTSCPPAASASSSCSCRVVVA